MKKLFVTLLFAGILSFIPSSLQSLIPSSLYAQIPSNGLVAWYPFNGNANDESGNGNHGLVNGATLTSDWFGNENQAFNFNGNSWIEILSSNSLNNSSVTISGWFNSAEYASDLGPGCKSIIGKWWGGPGICDGNDNSVLVVLTNPDGYSTLGSATSYYAGNVFHGQQVIPINQWVHFTIVHDENIGGKIFINGVLVNSTNGTGLICDSSNSFFIGVDKLYDQFWRYFNGSIDDLSIYGRPLDDFEVQSLYQDQTGDVQPNLSCNITTPTTTLCAGQSATLTVNTTGGVGASSQLPANLQQGLVAYYPFNGNANDESGNGENLQQNGPLLGEDFFGNSNTAMGFNGVFPNYLFSSNGYLNMVNTSLTVSAWIYPNSANAGLKSIVSKVSNTTTNIYGSYELSMEDGIVKFTLANPNGQPFWYNQCQTNGAISFNQWHHILGVADQQTNTMQLYVDGELIATNTWQGQLHNGSNQKLIIGASYKSNFSTQYVYHFNGRIDEVALYNRALSPAEIQQLYSAQSYAWSNNETTPTISVSPNNSTTYSCTVTQGNQTCTASVDITVNPAITNAVSATIVEGQSYTLGTQTLTTAGTYTEVFTSATGCDSTVTLTLAVEPLLTCNITTPTTTLCAGQSATLTMNTTGGAGASSQLPANLQQGLVAYYPFNGNANDESGNGNNGTVNGATLTADRFGIQSSAYSLDGLNDFINAPRTGLNEFSISFWTNLDSYNCYGAFIDAYESNWEFLIDCPLGSEGSQSQGNVEFIPWNGGSYSELPIGYVIPLNVWKNFVLVYSSNTMKFYVDGILITQMDGLSFNMTDGAFNFGASISGAPQFLHGKLDEILVFNRLLTISEIQQLYTAQSYAWSTSATTPTITVSPTQNTTYTCTVTQGIYCDVHTSCTR